MLTIVNTLNKKQIQKNQELEELEAKNSDKKYNLYTPKCEPRETKYQKEEILDDLMFSPCLQKCGYCIPAKLTTLNIPGPYSKWSKARNSFHSTVYR